MEWANLTSLVKDTESNLERVKWKLSSANSATFNQSIADSGIFVQSTYGGNQPLSLPYLSSTNFSQSYMNNGPMHSLTYNNTLPSFEVNRTPLRDNATVSNSVDHTSPLIATLNDRINDQNSIIEKLTQSLSQVHSEKDQFNKQLQQMKDEIAQLRSRLSGEDGIAAASERRIEGTLDGWRKHIMSDIGLLRQEIDLVKNSKEYETRVITDRGEQLNKLNSIMNEM